MHGACEVGGGLTTKRIHVPCCCLLLSTQVHFHNYVPKRALRSTIQASDPRTSPGSALPPFLAWCRYRVDSDNHSVSLVSAYYAPGTESDCRDTERAPLSSGPQPCGETELPLDNGNPVAWKGCVGESVRGRGGGEFRVKCIPRSGRP